jgi:cell division protein FtsB
MDIKEKNRAAQALKSENVRLNKLVDEYEELKNENSILKNKLKNSNASDKMNQMKRELRSLISNKIDGYKSELKYLKSSFKSEMSILRSSTESFVNNILLKCRETLMNSCFQKESELIKYKQSLLSTCPSVSSLQKELSALKTLNCKLSEENSSLKAKSEGSCGQNQSMSLLDSLKSDFDQKLQSFSEKTDQKLQEAIGGASGWSKDGSRSLYEVVRENEKLQKENDRLRRQIDKWMAK